MYKVLAVGYWLILAGVGVSLLYSAWAITGDVQVVAFSLGTADYSFTCPIVGLH